MSTRPPSSPVTFSFVHGLAVIGLSVTGLVVAIGSASAESPAPAAAVGRSADAVQDSVALAEDLTNWLNNFDAKIRAVTVTPDLVASEALSHEIGDLEQRQDDRMGANANALLKGAPATARARFALDAKKRAQAETERVRVANRSAERADAPPAARAGR